MRSVTLVAGPPAAGKSTYVASQAQPGDLVIDWERLVQAVSVDAGRAQDEPTRRLVGDLRRTAFASLGAAGENVRAWVIAGVPSASDRAQLAKEIGATETVLVVCAKEESYWRVAQDEARSAAATGQHEAIDKWWDRYEPLDTDRVLSTDPADGSKTGIKAPRIVVSDMDDTLETEAGEEITRVADRLRNAADAGLRIVIVSGRPMSRMEETRDWLDAHEIPHYQIHLSDFPSGPNSSRAFKVYKAKKLLEAGYEIVEWWENDATARRDLQDLGIDARSPSSTKSKSLPSLVAPDGAREEAKRALDWRREFGRGGTPVGVARARDLANGRELSIETVKRMVSYFARHEVDKEGQGWSPGEEGYPSAGRIAWGLWGGDPGRSWAERVLYEYETESEEGGPIDQSQKASTQYQEVSMNVKRISSAAHYQVKADAQSAPGGVVEALVSVFGNEDLVGDRVLRGAFQKSLDAYAQSGRSIPFVWAHSWDDPNAYIGKVVKAVETDAGLLVQAQLFNTTTAQHIKTLLQEGVVGEFSFAYDVISQAPGKDGVNELAELSILECGPCLKGANPATQLIGVRAYERATASRVEPQSEKAGRVLSAKNEDRLRAAADLIDEVLASLPMAEEKADTRMGGSDALLLLEFEELI